MTILYAIVIIIFVILSIVTYIYWRSPNRLLVADYIQSITTVGIILTIVAFIYNYRQSVTNDNNAAIESIMNTINNVNIQNEELYLKEYPHLEPLSGGIYRDSDKVEINNYIIHAGQIILQNFENVVTVLGGSTADWSDSTHSYWLATMRRWFSSATLRYLWDISQKLYGRDTVLFYDAYIRNHYNTK